MVPMKATYATRSGLLIGLLMAATALQIDWPASLGLCNTSTRPENPTTQTAQIAPTTQPKWGPEQIKFLGQQYENAVKEIQMRLEQERTLFAMKFALVGAILALLFTVVLKPAENAGGKAGTDHGHRAAPVVAMFCWAATITSAIVDTRILYNAAVTESLGTWIKLHVEPAFYSATATQTNLVGWETFFAKYSKLLTCSYYPFLRLNANLLTLFLFTATTLVFSRPLLLGLTSSVELSRVCSYGSCGCFIAFLLIAIHFHYWEQVDLGKHMSWPFICLVIAVFGEGMAWRYWRPLARNNHVRPSTVKG